MKAYRFESLKNVWEAGIEPIGPAIFYELIDDAYAIEVAQRILNRGEADLVRVSEVEEGEPDRLVQEVYA